MKLRYKLRKALPHSKGIRKYFCGKVNDLTLKVSIKELSAEL